MKTIVPNDIDYTIIILNILSYTRRNWYWYEL